MTPRSSRAPARPGLALLPAAPLLLATVACGGGGAGEAPAVVTPSGTGAGPDLVVEQMSFGPGALTAGAVVTTSVTVRNAGGQASGPFQMGVYLSSDALVTTSDVLLGFRTVNGLGAGLSSTASDALAIPITTLGGVYHVGAIADDQAAVAESNETNNALVAVGTVDVTQVPLPDLEASAVSFQPLVVTAGDAIDVTETVTNGGTLDAGALTVGLYLSSDPAITPADVLLGFRSIPSLAVGAVSTGTTTATVPLSTLAGLYYVGSLADDLDAHPEHDESDNVALAPVRIQVNDPPRPDLVPSGASFGPSAIDAGMDVQVSDVVLNQGMADAGGFSVGVYLSTDAQITTADRRVASHSLPGLAVGLYSLVSSLPVTIPIDTPAGVWHVGVLVDDQAVVAESDESNNALAASGTLSVSVPPTADLVASSVAFTPGSVQPALGEMLTITDRVRNEGVVPAGTFRVGYYLSSNPIVTAGGVFLGSRTINGLAVGSSSSGSAVVAVPPGLGPGSYFVGAIADDQDLVLEVQLANNVLVAAAPLDVVAAPMPSPELVVESVSFSPNVVVPGGSIQILELVRNLGTQSATAFDVGVYLSTDSDVSTDDVKLGGRMVSSLPIDFGSAKSAPYAIPAGTAPGTYFVGAVCDIHDQVAEMDESDNALTAVGLLVVN